MKLCPLLFAAGALVSSLASASSLDRAFTVKDDIAMVRFSDPTSEPSVPDSELAKRSPDGRYIAVVTTKGLLDRNRIESDVIVFQTQDVADFLAGRRAVPHPHVVASIVSFPHREQTMAYAPVIKDLRWSQDRANVYFRGENEEGAYQLFVARLDGRGCHPLTPHNQSVDRFDVVGDTIAYKASERVNPKELPSDAINADARAVTGDRIQDIIFRDQIHTIEPERFTLWALHHRGGRWVRRRISRESSQDIAYLSGFFPFTLSPRGTMLIAITPVLSIPDAWSRYQPVAGFEHLKLHGGDSRLATSDNTMRPQQYSLIDITSGERVPLLDAPNARSLAYYLDNSRVSWAGNERRVLVTNTFLRLENGSAENPEHNNRPCLVASVELPSRKANCLFFASKDLEPTGLHVLDVSFGADNDEATVILKQNVKGKVVQRYRFSRGAWQMVSSKTVEQVDKDISLKPHNDLFVSVRQGLNEPPSLAALDGKSGVAKKLWDPNPQFQHLRFGEASPYHWKDAKGVAWEGLLVKPVGYRPGTRYPLVLQMYSFVEDQFLTDGLYPSAFAARHLASAGFVVLQIKKKPNTLSEADPQIHLEGYRSAIDSLAAVGLIDRSKVGVVGFSWTCWYVINALIKDPKLFSVATIADGLDNSYMQYLIFGVGAYSIEHQMDKIRGSSPFGAGLKTWMQDAPGFHLDQVQSPIRMEAINAASVLQEWELYASLRMQKKPVDLIYFPSGTHIHQKPLERFESQQGNVDWLRFWLQGYEDPDPSKRSQYDRWKTMRLGTN